MIWEIAELNIENKVSVIVNKGRKCRREVIYEREKEKEKEKEQWSTYFV